MKSSTRSVVCVALLAMQLLSACATTWRPSNVAPATLLERDKPAQVRVRQTDDRVFILDNPTVVLDTLVGKSNLLERRIPLALIAELAVKQGGGGGGVIGGALVVLAVGFVALLVACRPGESGASKCS